MAASTILIQKSCCQRAAPISFSGTHGFGISGGASSFLYGSIKCPRPCADAFRSIGLEIPPALIVVDGSGEITLDAIDWLATQRVPLIRVRWNGEFASIVTTGGQAASAEKVYWQERTRDDPAARLRFARDLIRDKALSTLATMEDHIPRSAIWETSYKNIAARSRLLERRSPRSITELLGIEGSIANEYFRAWSRDGGCRFPGCDRTRFCEGHHVKHWADGGETKLDNLITLCGFHHRGVHEGGYGVRRTDDGLFIFTRPDGKLVEENGVKCFRGNILPPVHATYRGFEDSLRDYMKTHDPGLSVTAETSRCQWRGESMNYSQAIEAMQFLESKAANPEPIRPG